MFLAEGEEGVHETPAGRGEFFRDAVALNDVERGERGGHGRGIVPVAAGEKDAARGGFVSGAADARGNRMAVGEGLAVNREVRRVSVN